MRGRRREESRIALRSIRAPGSRIRKGVDWTSQPTPPCQSRSCDLMPFGTPPHRLGLNLSASALKSQAPIDPCGSTGPSNGLAAVHGASAHLKTASASLRHASLQDDPLDIPALRRAPARARDPIVLSDLSVPNRLPSHVSDALPNFFARRVRNIVLCENWGLRD